MDGESDVLAVVGQNFDHFSQRILSLGHAQTVSYKINFVRTTSNIALEKNTSLE
jgi:hypothetical protein